MSNCGNGHKKGPTRWSADRSPVWGARRCSGSSPLEEQGRAQGAGPLDVTRSRRVACLVGPGMRGTCGRTARARLHVRREVGKLMKLRGRVGRGGPIGSGERLRWKATKWAGAGWGARGKS